MSLASLPGVGGMAAAALQKGDATGSAGHQWLVPVEPHTIQLVRGGERLTFCNTRSPALPAALTAAPAPPCRAAPCA